MPRKSAGSRSVAIRPELEFVRARSRVQIPSSSEDFARDGSLLAAGTPRARRCAAGAGAPTGPFRRRAIATQWPLLGGFTPPVGSGLGGGTKLPEVGGVLAGGGGIKLPEVGGVLDGCGVAVGGGATKLPEVGGIAASPPVPALPPAARTPPLSVLTGTSALLGGGATKLPVVSGSCTQAAT